MLTFLFVACEEPVWTDERVYAVMKAAAGPSAISRSAIAMLQDCVDNGVMTTESSEATCVANHTDGEDNVLSGTMSWKNDTSDGESYLKATFDTVQFGGGEHEGTLDGTVNLPLSPGGTLKLEDVELSINGDPFEHWTEEDNEFLVAIAPLQFTYSSWKGDSSVGAAWASGQGSVKIDDDHDVRVGAWTEGGPACFDTLPLSRFEVEDDELDLTIEPSDWQACDACWTWRSDGGESGELCLNDVL